MEKLKEKTREFHVYYAKPEFFGGKGLENVTGSTIDNTHVFVKFLLAENREDVFRQMQGEVWNFNGEARKLIKRLGLEHTSMSVGDVVYDSFKRKWFIVANMGFGELPV